MCTHCGGTGLDPGWVYWADLRESVLPHLDRHGLHAVRMGSLLVRLLTPYCLPSVGVLGTDPAPEALQRVLGYHLEPHGFPFAHLPVDEVARRMARIRVYFNGSLDGHRPPPPVACSHCSVAPA